MLRLSCCHSTECLDPKRIPISTKFRLTPSTILIKSNISIRLPSLSKPEIDRPELRDSRDVDDFSIDYLRGDVEFGNGLQDVGLVWLDGEAGAHVLEALVFDCVAAPDCVFCESR